MSYRYTPWSNSMPQVWSIRLEPSPQYYFGKILNVSTDKEEIFTHFRKLEEQGIKCFIEDPKGNRVS